jgi:hypothetical protein
MLNFLAAATDGITLDSALTALNLGLAGIGLLAFTRGWIVPGKTYEESLRREAESRAEITELNKAMNDKFLPELQKARAVQIALGQLVDRVAAFVEKEESRES